MRPSRHGSAARRPDEARLQDEEFYRVGGTRPRRVDARVKDCEIVDPRELARVD